MQKSSGQLSWHCKAFADLEVAELYRIMQLRSEIFVVEQNCVYLDADDRDQISWHYYATETDRIVAYSRLVPPGISYPKYPSIGRIVVQQDKRGTGLGYELVGHSIRKIFEIYGETPIQIGAQDHLRKFYAALGFVPDSDVYDEDGIPHVRMIRHI